MWCDPIIRRGLGGRLAVLVFFAAAVVCSRSWTLAQETSEDVAGPTAAVPDTEADPDAAAAQSVDEATPLTPPRTSINIFRLFVSGGWLMVPIVLMSLLVVTFVIERSLALRRERVLPRELIRELGQMGMDHGSFDPREAYRVCQRYPSAAANVIRSMLLKVGRPHAEVEHSVAEASEREADRIYANVRWLNLAATVTPLLGLLGTVWGMIRAFHDTTKLPPGLNKADFLAGGIYEALVTTFSGLLVAIPAAFCAHYFEARITAMFHEIDELLFNLMPQVERYEGRVRFSRRQGEDAPEPPVDESQAAPAATMTN